MRIPLLVILILISTFSHSQEKFVLKHRNGNISEKGTYNSKGLKDGVWSEYFEDGKLSKSVEYKDGIPHGITREYYKNRQLKSETHYINNAVGSSTTYHENGQLERKNTKVNGKNHGKTLVYFSNGKLSGRSEYDMGTLVGIHESYYENGQLRYRHIYDSKGNEINKEEYFTDGRVMGKYITNTPNRKVYERYDENGIVSYRSTRSATGPESSTWYYDGMNVVEKEELYLPDEKYTYIRKDYNKDGRIKQETKVNGIGVEYEIIYNDSVTEYYSYKAGKRSGTFRAVYNHSEKIAEIGEYIKDSKSGIWKAYYKDRKSVV